MPRSAILGRALRLRCPRCGEGSLFRAGLTLHDRCPACGWDIRKREEATYFFMYASTAFLTGLIVLAMFVVTPRNLWVGRAVVAAAAVGVYLATHRLRKSLALAFEYWVERASGESPPD